MAENNKPQPNEAEEPKPEVKPDPIPAPKPTSAGNFIGLDPSSLTASIMAAQDAARSIAPRLEDFRVNIAPGLAETIADLNKGALAAIVGHPPNVIIGPPRITSTPTQTVSIPPPQGPNLDDLNNKVAEAREAVKKLKADQEAATKQIESARAEFQKLMDAANIEIKAMSDKLADQSATLDAQIETLKDQGQKVKDLSEGLEKNQVKLVETLGVFAAIFGFITISANILKDVQNGFVLVGGLLVSAGLMMGLLLVLDVIVRQWRYDITVRDEGEKALWKTWVRPQGVLLAFAVVMIIAGGIAVAHGNEQTQPKDSNIHAASPSPTPSPTLTPTPSIPPTASPKGQ